MTSFGSKVEKKEFIASLFTLFGRRNSLKKLNLEISKSKDLLKGKQIKESLVPSILTISGKMQLKYSSRQASSLSEELIELSKLCTNFSLTRLREIKDEKNFTREEDNFWRDLNGIL